jgi:hypothetical protein
MVTCYGRTVGRGWVQEWYETASRDAGRRTRELRKLGFEARSSAMGSQVTSVGHVKMTLVDVRFDTAGEPPPEPAKLVRVWSLHPGSEGSLGDSF